MFDLQIDIFYRRNGKTLQRDSSVHHIIFIKVVNKKAQNRTKTRKYSHINIHVRHSFNRDRSNND